MTITNPAAAACGGCVSDSFHISTKAHESGRRRRMRLQIREWLRQQTIRLVPGHEIERAEFDWFVDTVQTIDGAPETRREPAGQFVVHLGKESP